MNLSETFSFKTLLEANYRTIRYLPNVSSMAFLLQILPAIHLFLTGQFYALHSCLWQHNSNRYYNVSDSCYKLMQCGGIFLIRYVVTQQLIVSCGFYQQWDNSILSSKLIFIMDIVLPLVSAVPLSSCD